MQFRTKIQCGRTREVHPGLAACLYARYATEFHNVIQGQISGSLIEWVCSLLSLTFSLHFSECNRLEIIF